MDAFMDTSKKETPEKYAKMLLALCCGDPELAQGEVFEAAKNFPKIKNKFWREVFLLIGELAAPVPLPEEGEEPPNFEDDGRSQESANDRLATSRYQD